MTSSERQSPPGVGGGGTYTYANVASMESHGIEFTLSTQNIKKKELQLEHRLFIFSHTKNKVTDLKSLANVMDLISGNGFAREGYPVRGLFSIPFVGLDKNGLPHSISMVKLQAQRLNSRHVTISII